MAKKKKKVTVRLWRKEDIPAILECHRAAYPDYPEDGGHYNQRAYEMQLAAFPQGQLLAEIEGRVLGYATSLIVQLDDVPYSYTYEEITGAGTFSTHNPSGDTLYGADIAVHPESRGQGVAKEIYKHRLKILRRYNLRRMVAYGRIPGYKDMAHILTPEEYVEEVTAGRLRDQALSVHLRTGYKVKKVLFDFVADDSSMNHSTWLEMENPFFNPNKRKISASPLQRPVRKIRVCAAQYRMREISNWDDFKKSVTFFVDAVDTYHCHFLVFPELFTVQLFNIMPSDLDSHEQIKTLASYTERYIDMFTELARSSGIYIIGGSQPVLRDGRIYNVAHLFTPGGQVYTQDKIHITPFEKAEWNIRKGSGLKIFRTPLARIAIQVCYDVEFPETTRLLALAGVEVVFVPFSTDERKAFYRVRTSCQARAIENGIYMVAAGNVGNLPHRSSLLNYAQSGIYTPSDFEFPVKGIAGEAEPNVETVIISDLDMSDLLQHREMGSTRPVADRREDVYELKASQPIQQIRIEY